MYKKLLSIKLLNSSYYLNRFKIIYFSLAIIGSLVLLSGCGGSSSDDNGSSSGNNNNEYLGSWRYVEDGTKLYITTTTNLNIEEKINKDLLKINEAGNIKHIIRDGVRYANISGVVMDLSDNSAKSLSASRSFLGIGGIDIILKNIKDDKINTTIKTDKDGKFKDNTLPDGEYEIEGGKGDKRFKTKIKIDKDNTNLGEFVAVSENMHNFRTELILNNEFIYADGAIYSGVIRVNNISDSNGVGLTYDINIKDDYLEEFTKDIASAIGSIAPNGYKDIPVSFNFKGLEENQRSVDLNISIIDANSNKWQYTYTFQVYRGAFKLNIATKLASIKGYIVFPDTGKTKSINISNGTIYLPTLKDKQYDLVLSNFAISDETPYSIGVNTNTLDINNFINTPAHEPNNKKDEAKIIESDQAIVSYLHAGDIDYWKISISSVSDKLGLRIE
jgi:hypothetical protein